MGIVVQKFGGTSVRDDKGRRKVVSLVSRIMEQGQQALVVVSAMGRQGEPYATDTLLGLLSPSQGSDARERDLLASCGELISATVIASMLRSAGIRAQAFSGTESGIFTDENYGNARIVEVDPSRLLNALEDGVVPVVAGFQGVTRGGSVTTLGRGGSDTTAIALGAAVDAEVVEIYTDVDGIKTADPRIVPSARTIAKMDYEEVFQLANLGARVIHPRAVELARQFSVPLVVRSTFEDSPGTHIGASRAMWDPWSHRQPDRAVTGITQLSGLVQVRFELTKESAELDRTTLFEELGRVGVSVDLINLFPDEGYFCVPEHNRELCEDVLAKLGLVHRVEALRAKVSVVGSAIQGLPGVLGRVLAAVRDAGVEVLQSADSHSTISLLVHESAMEAAVVALHGKFGLDRD